MMHIVYPWPTLFMGAQVKFQRDIVVTPKGSDPWKGTLVSISSGGDNTCRKHQRLEKLCRWSFPTSDQSLPLSSVEGGLLQQFSLRVYKNHLERLLESRFRHRPRDENPVGLGGSRNQHFNKYTWDSDAVFTLRATSPVCKLYRSPSSITVASGPVRRGWGTVRVQGG